MCKILIIEDDTDINNMIEEYLRDAGFSCTQAFSGTEGLLHWKMDTFDFIIMDLMLPGRNGSEIIMEIRQKSKIPIIVLSALTGTQNKVEILSMGADDYLEKPFALEELLARIAVQERHLKEGGISENDKNIKYRSWHISKEARQLTVNGTAVDLTMHEYKIVKLLAGRPKKVFTKQEIYEMVWEEDYYVEDKTINVHISNIRSKLRPTGTEEYIKTVWGIGFTLS